MITGIATAMLDSSPIVCITGQVGSKLIGSDAFQETDITGVTLPITKHNYLVTHASEVARTIREAFYVARSGRPGSGDRSGRYPGSCGFAASQSNSHDVCLASFVISTSTGPGRPERATEKASPM